MLHRPFCRRLLHRSHVNDLSAIRLHSSPFESMPSNLTHRQHAITGSRATAHTKFRLRTKFFNVLFDRNAQGPYCVSSHMANETVYDSTQTVQISRIFSFRVLLLNRTQQQQQQQLKKSIAGDSCGQYDVMAKRKK